MNVQCIGSVHYEYTPLWAVHVQCTLSLYALGHSELTVYPVSARTGAQGRYTAQYTLSVNDTVHIARALCTVNALNGAHYMCSVRIIDTLHRSEHF